MHRQLYDDQIALGDDAMDLSRRSVEIVAKSLHRLPETVTTLRPGRVLDEVFRDQI